MTDPSAPRRTLPLALLLLIVLTALVGGVAGIVIFESYRRGVEVGAAAGRQLFANLRTDIAVQQQQLTEPLRGLVDILAEEPLLGEGRAEDLQPLILAALRRHPQMAELRIAYENGTLFAVTPLSGAGAKLKDSFAAPAEARYAARRVVSFGGAWQLTWQFLDESGRKLDELIVQVPRHAPTHESWYIAGQEAAGAVAQTKTDLIASLHSAGMSYAKRFGGSSSGVIAADVALSQLSDTLKYLLSSDSDFIALFDGDGMLLAYPDNERVVASTTGSLSLGRIADIQTPVARAMLQRFHDSGAFSLQVITAEGTEFLTSVTRVGDSSTRPAYLAVALPAATFTGVFSDISRETAILSLIILALAVPLIVVVARRVSRPLARLEAATQRIAALTLDEPVHTASRIGEIGRLGASIERMRNALGQIAKFVPKTVVQDLIRSGAKMEVGGERRELTFLFTDVRDFTPLAESLAPEDLMAQMSRYFECLVGAVLAKRGTVDKFIGDALFAFWNAPLREPAHTQLACEAALAARTAARDFNAELVRTGRQPWHTRFGLHVGEAVVGNVGASDRLDYTAIGSAVNLAARLEGLNKFYGTEILASEDVAACAGEEAVFRPVDCVLAKGAGTALNIVELLAANERALAESWRAVYAVIATRQWDAALRAVQAHRQNFPGDELARIYAARLEDFITTPPPADWDGVTRFDSK